MIIQTFLYIALQIFVFYFYKVYKWIYFNDTQNILDHPDTKQGIGKIYVV